jgi:Tfp pilus assembly protein PilV
MMTPRASRKRCGRRGSSLIEVLLSVSVMSLTMLGFVATLLWSARQMLAVGYREDAVWTADALTEAARAPQRSDGAITHWQARASAQLPHAEVTLQMPGSGAAAGSVGANAGMARVMWSMPAAYQLDWTEPADTCGAVSVPKGMACATFAFVRGGDR